MQKMLLISILFATVLVPLFVARGGSVKSAVRRTIVATCIFCTLYWLGLMFVYPSLAKPPGQLQQEMNGTQTTE